MTVTATADAEVVEQVPGLAEDLRFEDCSGGRPGPSRTDGDGHWRTDDHVRHAVSSADEATNLLASLGPPFVDVRLTRTIDGDDDHRADPVSSVLENRFDSFADSDLLARPAGAFATDLARHDSRGVDVGAAAHDCQATSRRPPEPRWTVSLEWSAQLDGSARSTSRRGRRRSLAPRGPRSSSVTALVLLGV